MFTWDFPFNHLQSNIWFSFHAVTSCSLETRIAPHSPSAVFGAVDTCCCCPQRIHPPALPQVIFFGAGPQTCGFQPQTELVGGWAYPSEKYESQLGLLFPIYGEKTCSKPPTRNYRRSQELINADSPTDSQLPGYPGLIRWHLWKHPAVTCSIEFLSPVHSS